MINILPVVINDEVTGMKITIREGLHFNVIHVEYDKFPFNRDFFFTKNGELDGTGSPIPKKPKRDKGKTDGVQ